MGWMPTFFKETLQSPSRRGRHLGHQLSSRPRCSLGKLVGGAWADRWSRTNERARILVPAIGMFIAAPATLLVANTSVLAFAIAGLVALRHDALVFRRQPDAHPLPGRPISRYRATGYGVLNMFACIIGGLTIYVGGAMRDAQINVSTLFQSPPVGLLVCAVLLLFVKSNAPPIAGGNDDS